jgi:hypothetical protein
MTNRELQDYIHVYSMFSFRDGRKEPGICINKYNVVSAQIDYYFISQNNLQAYKTAFDRFERDTCNKLSELINPDDLLAIRPVSLEDYKMVMELLHERNLKLNFQR